MRRWWQAEVSVQKCADSMFEQGKTCMLCLVLCCRQRGFRSLERVDLPLPCFHTRLQLLGPLGVHLEGLNRLPQNLVDLAKLQKLALLKLLVV